MNVDAAGVYSTYDIWVQTSCFSDPDGDTFTIYASQPNYGSITGVSSCASNRTCWQYHSYGGWDGTPYWTTFTFYARDPDGATSAAGTYNLCVNC